jgi:hypothetical protein
MPRIGERRALRQSVLDRRAARAIARLRSAQNSRLPGGTSSVTSTAKP